MKQRLLIATQAAMIGFFILSSCSKSGINEQQAAAPIDLVKSLSPGPMPPDTLELDSLRRPPSQ